MNDAKIYAIYANNNYMYVRLCLMFGWYIHNRNCCGRSSESGSEG